MQSSSRWFVLGMILVAVLYCHPIASAQDPVPQDILTKKNPIDLSNPVVAKAKTAYESNCLQCHGPGGRGDGPMSGMLKEKPADLTNSALLSAITDGQLFWTVTKGKLPIMPAFESKLTPDERWSLVHLLRSISNTPPNNDPKKKP